MRRRPQPPQLSISCQRICRNRAHRRCRITTTAVHTPKMSVTHRTVRQNRKLITIRIRRIRLLISRIWGMRTHQHRTNWTNIRSKCWRHNQRWAVMYQFDRCHSRWHLCSINLEVAFRGQVHDKCHSVHPDCSTDKVFPDQMVSSNSYIFSFFMYICFYESRTKSIVWMRIECHCHTMAVCICECAWVSAMIIVH